MDEFKTYQIEIRDRVDEKDINALGPLQIMGMRVETDATRFTVHTDQSGLIGLLRYLHGRGFVLRSVQDEQNE
jgi:hypothetical protein